MTPLRQRMIEDMQLRGFSPETQRVYLHARGFRVVLNYHPLRRDGEEDAGEVDVICQRDGHLFVIEVKSTYVRKDFREAWQHKY